ncbi:MAG: hypothetical protein KA275_02350 [Chitinophagaceae bacterium]|nr:hypothetical protein [Chitinophagaceae bacterium]
MKDISAILVYLKGKWNIIFIYIICNLIAVFFSLISLAMLVPFLKMIFGDDALLTSHPGLIWSADGLLQLFKYYLSQLIISHNGDKIWGLLFIIVIVIISNFLKNLFIYFSRYLLHPLRNSIVMKMRINLFQKAIQLPIGFFSNERKGDIISRMTNDVTEVEISIMSVMELLFSTPVVVIFYLMVMLSISAKLCLFLILLLPIAGFIIGRISKSLKKQSTETQEKLGSLLSIIDETLSGLRIVKAFRAETNRVHIFKKENNSIFRINNAIAKKRELASPLSEFLGVSVLCIILWFGGKLVLGKPQEIDGGQFIMFILIFTQLLDPLKKLSQVFYNIAKGRASLERMNKILNAENKIVDVTDANTIESFNSEIEFKNVCFEYEEKQVLKKIN